MFGYDTKRSKQYIANIARSLLYKSGLLAKKTEVVWDKCKKINCTEETKPIYIGASNIFYINTKTDKGYFRAVFRHVSYKKCVLEAVNTWYTFIHPEQFIEFANVNKALENKSDRRKFFDMGNLDDPYSRARKFYETKDTRLVGITTPSEFLKGSEEWNNYISNIYDLLRYVRNAMCRHRRNQAGGKWEFSGVNRQMATQAVAVLLGLDYMIPRSEFVTVQYANIEMLGLLMDVAEGENTETISSERSHSIVSPSLQHDLTSLNLMDAITFERDHRPGNYNVVLDDNGKVTKMSVFDNDAEMTFAPFPVNYQSCHGSSGFINQSGMVNRPYLDKTVANRVVSLSLKELRQALGPYLNSIQIYACYKRVKKIKKAIERTMVKNNFLLEDEEWTEQTVLEELSGKYGRTYLELFVNWQTIIKPFYEYAHCAD